ncbi:MAG: hypothetical protein ACOCVQ_03415, partial [Bacillota bacterium]
KGTACRLRKEDRWQEIPSKRGSRVGTGDRGKGWGCEIRVVSATSAPRDEDSRGALGTLALLTRLL